MSVTSGSAAASEEKELAVGKTYYWQATYKGDGTHQESTSECGGEIATIIPAPSATCPITLEGIVSSTLVTTSNESALRESVLNDTWGPGGIEGKCEEVTAFGADVIAGKITTAQQEDYEKYIAELVVPGTYVCAFKWHSSGGNFETMGVVSAGALEFEPIVRWDQEVSTFGEESETTEEKEADTIRKMPFVVRYLDPLFRNTVSTGRSELQISTPDDVKISAYSTLLSWENFFLDNRLAMETTSERVYTEGSGLQCYESKVRLRFTSFFGIFEHVQEKLYTLCANGTFNWGPR